VKHRFKDQGQRIYDFMSEFLVRCPRCDKCARVMECDPVAPEIRAERGYPPRPIFAPRRLVCEHCGLAKDSNGNRVGYPETCDKYFGEPLWLQIPCCNEILWAYNEKHLDFLESFVKAELREAYPNQTFASRLPEWMKLATHREEILKCIRKLRETLPN
jgi:hypothetical protein